LAGRPDLTANKALVRRFFEEGLGGGNLDLIDELVAPDAVMHNPLILDAPRSVRGSVEMLRRAFPDLGVDVLDLIAEGDRVAAFLRLSGTNTGTYRRGGATHRQASMRAFFIWRIVDGRLVESWGVADRFDFLQQLGIIGSDDELGANR
jgi:predicted ester cyclase